MDTPVNGIPVLDFSKYSIQLAEGSVSDADKTELAGAVVSALQTVGFLYLKHHGINMQQVQKIHDTAGEFFRLPDSTKSKYKMANVHGWVPLCAERNNPDRSAGDLKESFYVTPSKASVWPDSEVPGFQQCFLDVFSQCERLMHRMLRLTAIGLNLQDPEFFVSRHSTLENNGHSPNTMKTLHYPPLPDSVEAGQVRLGEHTDYGSMTLLFQDQTGGLEVKRSDGVYVAATPIPDTIVVNIGGLMERWTADKLKATEHRVLIPDDKRLQCSPRHSLAFFAHPDDDCIVQPVDDSNKYPPISAGDYLKMRLGATLKNGKT